jgi:hypothetical protein
VGELEVTKDEAVVASFSVLSQHSPERPKKEE